MTAPDPGSLYVNVAGRDSVGRLMTALERWAEEQKLPAATRHALAVAVDEHVSNVMNHGYGTRTAGTVDVCARRQDDWISVEIRDRAQPFDPLTGPVPAHEGALDARRPGGLGLHLLRTLVDHASYRSADGENVLVLRKRVG